MAKSRQKRLLRLPPRLLDPYMSQLFFRLQLFYFEAGFHCEHFSFIVFPTLFCEALLIRPLVATLWTLSIKEDHIAELLSISRKESRRGSWSLIPHSRSFFHEYPASRIPHPASRLFISAFLNPVFCVRSLVWNSHFLLEYVTRHVLVVTISRIYDRHVKKPAWSAHILPTNPASGFT